MQGICSSYSSALVPIFNNIQPHGCFLKLLINVTWRTLAYQEVRLRIGPLAKLGRFKSTADNFLVYIVTISLASGPIRSLTSWYAKVLHECQLFKLSCDSCFQHTFTACSCVFKVINYTGLSQPSKVITSKAQLHAVNAP